MDQPDTITVHPGEGRKVRFPADHRLAGQFMPPEGGVVPASPYWLRRLRDGDVIEGAAPAAKPAKPAPNPKD